MTAQHPLASPYKPFGTAGTTPERGRAKSSCEDAVSIGNGKSMADVFSVLFPPEIMPPGPQTPDKQTCKQPCETFAGKIEKMLSWQSECNRSSVSKGVCLPDSKKGSRKYWPAWVEAGPLPLAELTVASCQPVQGGGFDIARRPLSLANGDCTRLRIPSMLGGLIEGQGRTNTLAPPQQASTVADACLISLAPLPAALAASPDGDPWDSMPCLATAANTDYVTSNFSEPDLGPVHLAGTPDGAPWDQVESTSPNPFRLETTQPGIPPADNHKEALQGLCDIFAASLGPEFVIKTFYGCECDAELAVTRLLARQDGEAEDLAAAEAAGSNDSGSECGSSVDVPKSSSGTRSIVSQSPEASEELSMEHKVTVLQREFPLLSVAQADAELDMNDGCLSFTSALLHEYHDSVQKTAHEELDCQAAFQLHDLLNGQSAQQNGHYQPPTNAHQSRAALEAKARSQLQVLKLQNPSCAPDVLENLFALNDNDLDRTRRDLAAEGHVDRDAATCSAVARSGQAFRPRPSALDRHTMLQEQWEENQATIAHCRQRKEAAIRSAYEARRAHDEPAALQMQAEADKWARKLQAAYKMNSKKMFKTANLGNVQQFTWDLHGLTIREALEVAQAKIEWLKRGEGETVEVTFVTGRGKHSVDNRPRLHPAIKELVQELGYIPEHSDNDGVVIFLMKTGGEEH